MSSLHSVRALTNQTIPVTATQNNYLQQFQLGPGNLSSISLFVTGTWGAAPTFSTNCLNGMMSSFGRFKVQFDGRTVFDHVQTSNSDANSGGATQDVNVGLGVIDAIRSVLNGRNILQYIRPSKTDDTIYYGYLQIPMMMTISSSVQCQITYDTNDQTQFADAAATSMSADVLVNYVDSVTGSYTTRQLQRYNSLSTSGAGSLIEIPSEPNMEGYSLAAVFLYSTNADNVKKDQFGPDSRITVQDINGNVLLKEASGVEYNCDWGMQYGRFRETGAQVASIGTTYPPALASRAATGQLLIDCGEVTGPAILKLLPDASVANLDITAIYVRRNTSDAAPAQVRQLARQVDVVGAGMKEIAPVSGGTEIGPASDQY